MTISSTQSSQAAKSNPFAILNGKPASGSTSAASSAAAGASSSTSASNPQSAQAIQNEFLTLLTTQLQTQDPSNPMDNSQITSQMAQISQVAGTQTLEQSVQQLLQAQMSSQSLMASTTIGRQAMVAGNTLQWDANTAGTPVTGAVSLASAAKNLSVTVQNAAGQTVDTLNVANPTAGMNAFSWNGTDSSGNKLPAGAYTFNATATTTSATGAATQVTVTPFSNQTIDAVSWDNTGATQLQLSGGSTVPLSSVQQIS
jgi:flagellar basal-body rod modification protein FlgD